jgi:hypothetical protein
LSRKVSTLKLFKHSTVLILYAINTLWVTVSYSVSSSFLSLPFWKL